MVFIGKHGNQIAEHMRRRRKAVQEHNGGSISGTGFAIEYFQPLHVKRAIENGQCSRFGLGLHKCLLYLMPGAGVVLQVALGGADRTQPADLDSAGRPRASMGRVAHGRTRMTVFPLRRSVGFKAATASSRVETLPMFVRRPPSRNPCTHSLSWARSDSTTKSTARPSAGRASAGPTMDTSVP